jgi:hypothetical protein
VDPKWDPKNRISGSQKTKKRSLSSAMGRKRCK